MQRDTAINYAKRLVSKYSLFPPIDLEQLARYYANLEYIEMPVEIDGISNNLKVSGKKPTIYVNTKDRAINGQRFTLAHEIGHIIIPWHIGTISDNIIEQPITEYSIDYRDIEDEANAFASELLMPSAWLSELVGQEKYRDIALLSKDIAREARVSLVAACFRLRSFLPPGYIFILSNLHGIIQYSGKTHGTLSTLPRIEPV